MRSLFLCAILLSAAADVRAEEGGDDKRELTKAVGSAEVANELNDAPDGATMQLTPDGGWRIFAIGRGTYDFDDNDDIQQARQEAMLQAKAHIAKFMGETVTSDETLGRLSEKKKSLSSSGGGSVEKTDVKTMTTMIRSQAKQLLAGVITLETSRQPNPSGGGGSFVVKVGISNKTVAVSGRVKGDIAAAAASGGTASAAAAATAASPQSTTGAHGLNTAKSEKASSDF
jgi:hypothetical protein